MSVVRATEIRKYLCQGNSERHETQKKITKGNEKARNYFAGTDRKHAANDKNN